MDKGKMNRVTIGITVMILLAVFLFLGYPLLNLDREEIVLPGENSASDISDPGEGAGVEKSGTGLDADGEDEEHQSEVS